MKFPANASVFNAFLIDIATFEVLPSEDINRELYVLPEAEPYNINFQQSRIDSIYAIPNVGTILYILIVYAILIITERIWSLFSGRICCKRSVAYLRKIQSFLYWGALNTLALEIYLDVGLSSTLNIHTMRWLDNNPDLVVTNVFAIGSLVFIIVYPIWLVTFYFSKFKKWRDEDFQHKYGSVLDGTKYSDENSGKWLPMVQPIVFIVRRACFIFAVIVISEFLWMQLALQYLFSVFLIIYLTYFKPLDSLFQNRMETFNECTCIFLMYHLMCFSDFVPSAATRSALGISFITFIFFNVSVHLYFMLKDCYYKLKKKIMQKFCLERWRKQALEKHKKLAERVKE